MDAKLFPTFYKLNHKLYPNLCTKVKCHDCHKTFNDGSTYDQFKKRADGREIKISRCKECYKKWLHSNSRIVK